MLAFCCKLTLQLVYPSTIHVLEPCKFSAQLLVFECNVLVLVQDVVLTELQLRYNELLLRELVLQLNQLVFKVYSRLPLDVQFVFQTLAHLLKLLTLSFDNSLHLAESAVHVLAIVSAHLLNHLRTSRGRTVDVMPREPCGRHPVATKISRPICHAGYVYN